MHSLQNKGATAGLGGGGGLHSQLAAAVVGAASAAASNLVMQPTPRLALMLLPHLSLYHLPGTLGQPPPARVGRSLQAWSGWQHEDRCVRRNGGGMAISRGRYTHVCGCA
jgi:hypothetical protein